MLPKIICGENADFEEFDCKNCQKRWSFRNNTVENINKGEKKTVTDMEEQCQCNVVSTRKKFYWSQRRVVSSETYYTFSIKAQSIMLSWT